MIYCYKGSPTVTVPALYEISVHIAKALKYEHTLPTSPEQCQLKLQKILPQ